MEFMTEYLSNLQLNVTAAAYTKVTSEWQDFDFIPAFNRFYFICDGEGYLKIEDRQYYPLQGQLFLLPAGVKQSYSTINSNGFTKYWCHFTAQVGSFNLFQLFDVKDFIVIDNSTRLESKFKELICHFQNTSIPSILQTKALLLEIISLFMEHNEIKQNSSKVSSIKKINQILNYIDQHLSENIAIEELAELIHFHPNYFIPFFKGIMGASPIQYINKLKMEKAKQLLITNDTVSEIANKIGMNNHYFSRTFKASTGYTPTMYRNMLQKNTLTLA